MSIKISIIVPIYNVEQYIKECFDSIVTQTYSGGMECIFVDDCGQDHSVEILEKLITNYHGDIDFSIIHYEHNKGLSGARNTGIHHATGDYLYFLDSDDTLTPDCIERLVALVLKYPRVEVVQGSANASVNWLVVNETLVPEYSENFAWIRKSLLRRFLPMTAWNKLVLRTFVLKHDLYFAEGMIHEDEIWKFMMAKYVHHIAFCFVPTYNYRENNNGIMSKMKKNANRYLPIVDYMSRHTSGPYFHCELECILTMLAYGENLYRVDEYLKNIPCNLNLMKLIIKIKERVNHTTKRSFTGIIWRIVYLFGAKFMDMRYNLVKANSTIL